MPSNQTFRHDPSSLPTTALLRDDGVSLDLVLTDHSVSPGGHERVPAGRNQDGTQNTSLVGLPQWSRIQITAEYRGDGTTDDLIAFLLGAADKSSLPAGGVVHTFTMTTKQREDKPSDTTRREQTAIFTGCEIDPSSVSVRAGFNGNPSTISFTAMSPNPGPAVATA
ncbi:MAG: hypothetical protein AAGB51_06250 [Planctomycetota bacterium]